jgi:hypothetical protein
MTPRQIEVHIGRIALTAMPAGGERRLREAVERALAGMVREAHDQARVPARRHGGETGQPNDASPGRGAGSVAERIGRHVRAGLPEPGRS